MVQAMEYIKQYKAHVSREHIYLYTRCCGSDRLLNNNISHVFRVSVTNTQTDTLHLARISVCIRRLRALATAIKICL